MQEERKRKEMRDKERKRRRKLEEVLIPVFVHCQQKKEIKGGKGGVFVFDANRLMSTL